MRRRGRAAKSVEPHIIWLYRIGALAALLAGLLLLLGIPSLSGSSVLENWLIILFKVHSGSAGATTGLLQGLRVVDISILGLVGVMCLALYAALRSTTGFWAAVAAVQPWLGIVLLGATKNVGRSAVMGASLVISFVMMRRSTFTRFTAVLGILASVLLLIGDFTAGMPASIIVSAMFGVAYVVFVVWLFLVARRLWQLGRSGSKARTP